MSGGADKSNHRGLLEGIRVLEYGVFHAGPGASAILGDLGAEVIKIEAGMGDPERYRVRVGNLDFSLPNGDNVIFHASNRNKRGIYLDIEKPEGRAVFHRLVEESEPFDLAVLDIMGVDGYKLLEIANSKGVRAVMLTAHAFTPDNIVRSIKEGAVSYVPKDEMAHIADFLADVLEAGRRNENPWDRWQKRLPSSYFEQKFGAAWKDADKDFWDTFKAGLRARSRSDN